MNSTRAFRPARRIPADRLAVMRAKSAAATQAREDVYQQSLAPVEEFASAPRLTMLPGGLHWSAQRPVPAVGTQVEVVLSGRRDVVKVMGYCHAAGFLGLVTEPYHPGSIRARKLHPRARCVFGTQLVQAA
ncbi:MAG: hypothetical protein NVS3B25_34860 [Hymenobacter sp.]